MPGENESISIPALQEAVAAGVVSGIKSLANDADFIEHFWLQGYKQMSIHVTNGTSQWVGKRIITTIVLSLVTAGVIWLVKSGAIR